LNLLIIFQSLLCCIALCQIVVYSLLSWLPVVEEAGRVTPCHRITGWESNRRRKKSCMAQRQGQV